MPIEKAPPKRGLVTNMENESSQAWSGWTTMKSCVQNRSEASNFLPQKAPPKRNLPRNLCYGSPICSDFD